MTNENRVPGPINLNREDAFTGGIPPYVGIQTFLKLPLCLTSADLEAGAVDVAIGGVPWDGTNTLRGGTRLGPQAIRQCDTLWAPPYERPHLATRVDAVGELRMADYGDVVVLPGDTNSTLDNVRRFVREILDGGALPVILGGDHAITWPCVSAVADVYGHGTVGVIQFDAHADFVPLESGQVPNHGTPMWQLVDSGAVRPEHFIQVGLRGYHPGPDTIAWMEERGIRTHYMAEIEHHGFEAVLDRVVEEARGGAEHLYITVDVDGVDPSHAPGTGSPEPGGLTGPQVLRAVRRLAHEVGIVGMDVVEVNPMVDVPSQITAVLAHRCVLEAMTGHAMRRSGITEPKYVHPGAARLDGR